MATTRSRSASVSTTGAASVTSIPPPPVPSPGATHSSFIPSRYVKHASLINNCYPARPDEKGPKSSELSYLVFYATSKPAKLTKVGNYIERRVVRDIRKKRLSDVHCSLEIIKSVLVASKAHLNIFAKNIVSILDTLLADLSDFDIVRHCQNVFAVFCSAHDGSTLGVDAEFRSIYDRVVLRFAEIATIKFDQPNTRNRYRMVGLRALNGVASSQALYACDHKAQLNMVLPSILDILIESKTTLDAVEPSEPVVPQSPRRSMSIHQAVHPDNTVLDDDVTAEALLCLRALFKTPNGANVRLTLGPTFTYLDDNMPWWPATFGVGIIKVILNSILPQFRYMLVNELIIRLDGVEASTPDPILCLQKRATLISALEAILTSSLSFVGMPVLEVLNSLLSTLTKSLASSSNSNTKEGQLVALENVIQDGLVNSIGGLATHIYYSNQIPHIISHLVGKLSNQVGASLQPPTIEGVPTAEYRIALLKCLKAVIRTSKKSGRQSSSFNAVEVSAELLTPCLGLLLESNVGVRTGFAQVLITFLMPAEEVSTQQGGAGSGVGSSAASLNNVNNQASGDDASSSSSHSIRSGSGHGDDAGGAGSPSRSPSVPIISSDLYFRAAAHQTLHAYACLPTATPADMAAIYGILRALFAHYEDDEFIRVVPLLFSLQDWCLGAATSAADAEGKSTTDVTAAQASHKDSEGDNSAVARKRALATVILIYLQKSVHNFGMQEPQEYLETIKQAREEAGQWMPIYYENQESLTRLVNTTSGSVWDKPSEPTEPVLAHPLARDHLITLLTTTGSDRFRSAAERFALAYNPESPTGLLNQSAGGLVGGLASGLFLSAHMAGAMSGSTGGAGGANGLGSHPHHRSERSVDSRIRISRHLDGWSLPKLPQSLASSTGDLSTTQEEEGEGAATATTTMTTEGSLNGTSTIGHRHVGIENLKEALAAASQGVDGSGTATTTTTASVVCSSSDAASSIASNGGGRYFPLSIQAQTLKKQQQAQHLQDLALKGQSDGTLTPASHLAASRPDLANLLNTIHIPAVTVSTNTSTLSLVTPPY
ncbi:plasma membrane localization protein [Actinomortierella ambigua]|nr:plasma membrane localization protein [Actinomortierella ambigua]